MFRLFFGSPGCGKTTTAVWMIYKDRTSKKPLYDYHFTNFDCKIARKCDLSGLGSWTFPEFSYIACDEAGVEFNSRLFKQMLSETMEYCKEHRHFKVDFDYFSQTWSDVDKVIRDLAEEVWHLKKIGPFTLCRRIKKKVDIDEQTHQPMDMFYKLKMIRRFLPFPFNEKSFFLVYRPSLYKYFDTYERKNLPIKHFGSTQKDTKIDTSSQTYFKKIKSVFLKKARPPESTNVGENSTVTGENIEAGDLLKFP